MKKNNSYSVVNCIARIRKERGETQVELATAIGVTRQTIIAIEKGDYTPSVLVALRLASHFDTPIEELFCMKKLRTTEKERFDAHSSA